MKNYAKQHNGLIAFIAILLVLILVGGIIGGLYYFNRCLFGHDYGEDGICTRCGKEKLDKVEEVENDDPAKEAAVNGGGLATVLPGNGIRLMAAKMSPIDGVPTAVSENTWTLTASVNQEADDKSIDWSVRWKDAQASFAQGKTVTDYLTVTPTSDGALTATVKVVKDFGAQIEVVATSSDNPSKSAVCLFDYVKKITGFTFNGPDIDSLELEFDYDVEYSNYTVDSTLELGFYNATPSGAADTNIGQLNPALLSPAEKKLQVLCGLPESPDMSHDLTIKASFCFKFVTLYIHEYEGKIVMERRGDPLSVSTKNTIVDTFVDFSEDGFYTYIQDTGKIVSAFRYAVDSNSDYHFYFGLTYSAVYNEQTYSSGKTEVRLKFDGSAIHVPVTDVTLDQSHIYA